MSPTLLQVAQLGHPILRKKSLLVDNVRDMKIQQLIANLIATVMDVDGVGISAPQVYQPVRLFIMASHPNARYPQAPLMEPTAIINPKIVSHSKSTEKDWEGCLSVPGIRALIPRWTDIRVSYVNQKGDMISTKYSGFLARIFQHELDHLNGIVFLDRVQSSYDIISEKEYQKMISKRI